MKPAWINKAAALPARQLHLLGGGVLLIAAAALWSYGVKAPLAALRTVQAEQARLGAGADTQLLEAQLAALAGDTQVLAKRLGATQGQPAAQLMVGLIGDVGTLARTHGVKLHGAAPASEQRNLGFEQVAFDADVSGGYAGLLAWMEAVERSRPNLSIASFEMRAAKTPGQVDMKIRIAALRPQEGTP